MREDSSEEVGERLESKEGVSAQGKFATAC